MAKYSLASTTWDDKELAAIQSVIASDMFTMGPRVAEYEKSFADHFGSRHAVMVSSGSTANLLMIAALFYRQKDRLKRGDEVIVPAVSWSTTYYPLYQYGLKLVFVDIDERTLNMDLEKLRGAITDRTRAILTVNLLGNPNDFDAIRSAIAGRDIILLEDNCESMGATFGGKQAGTFGLMGTFSSFFSHHISTMEGGCIVTDDDELHHVLLCLRAHGWTRNLPKENLVTGVKSDDPFEESFKFVLPGYNVRPLEMSGAIGIEQLKKLPKFIETRRDNAARFVDMFANHPYLRIQREVGRSSWFGFSFVVDPASGVSRRDCLRKLAEHDIEYRPIVSGNFVKNAVVEYFDYRVAGDVAAAEKIDTCGFFVGNHHIDLTDELALLGRALAP